MANEPGEDSKVDDWFGESVDRDAEVADELVEEVGEQRARGAVRAAGRRAQGAGGPPRRAHRPRPGPKRLHRRGLTPCPPRRTWTTPTPAFKQHVNMSASQLERWLDRDRSKEVGQKRGGGESTGHVSGRRYRVDPADQEGRPDLQRRPAHAQGRRLREAPPRPAPLGRRQGDEVEGVVDELGPRPFEALISGRHGRRSRRRASSPTSARSVSWCCCSMYRARSSMRWACRSSKTYGPGRSPVGWPRAPARTPPPPAGAAAGRTAGPRRSAQRRCRRRLDRGSPPSPSTRRRSDRRWRRRGGDRSLRAAPSSGAPPAPAPPHAATAIAPCQKPGRRGRSPARRRRRRRASRSKVTEPWPSPPAPSRATGGPRG